jgi:hypothetical protein
MQIKIITNLRPLQSHPCTWWMHTAETLEQAMKDWEEEYGQYYHPAVGYWYEPKHCLCVPMEWRREENQG